MLGAAPSVVTDRLSDASRRYWAAWSGIGVRRLHTNHHLPISYPNRAVAVHINRWSFWQPTILPEPAPTACISCRLQSGRQWFLTRRSITAQRRLLRLLRCPGRGWAWCPWCSRSSTRIAVAQGAQPPLLELLPPRAATTTIRWTRPGWLPSLREAARPGCARQAPIAAAMGGRGISIR